MLRCGDFHNRRTGATGRAFMNTNILSGLRVVEGAAFVASPSCGMTLSQLGADVIRFDPLEGGLDAHRWPVTREGRSLFWAGLNKGKRSIAVNLRSPEGQELLTGLIAAPGEGGGIFSTNLPATGWMSYDKLRARRADLVMVNVLGNADGTSAVDYTVNCATGFPFATGPAHGEVAVNPVNHVLPAWDLLTGMAAALAIVAAERHRRLTGAGQLVRVPLADIAFATVANLGWLAKAQVNQEDHFAVGNYLYGAYGSEFRLRDGRYCYVVGLTRRMWDELCKATGTTERMSSLGQAFGADLSREGERYRVRHAITALLAPWFETRTLAEVESAFAGTGVCWGPYRSFRQLLDEDPRVSEANPLFATLDQPGIGPSLVAGSPLQFSATSAEAPRGAPRLGEHTDEVLATLLGLSDGQIGALRDRGVVGGPIDLGA
jgi:2-methylfumaryl-CoA isomerase